MNVFSVSHHIASKLASQVGFLDRVRQEIVAATARLLQPKPVLVPIRVVVDRETRARRRD